MAETLFFIMDELSGKEHGPYALAQIQPMIYDRKLKKNHLVRKADYPKWFKAGELLTKLFAAVEQDKIQAKQEKLANEEERRFAQEEKQRLAKEERTRETNRAEEERTREANRAEEERTREANRAAEERQRKIEDGTTNVEVLRDIRNLLRRIYGILLWFFYMFIVLPFVIYFIWGFIIGSQSAYP